MIEIKLKDDVKEYTFSQLEVPLTEDTIENATDVQTLDYNIYTDFINQKRQWTHKWAYMSESEYNEIRGFYDRQFTEYKYPLMTVSYYGITDVPVRIKMDAKNTINNCGMIQDVVAVFRETSALPAVEVS